MAMKWTFLWKVSKPTRIDASRGPLPGMLPLSVHATALPSAPPLQDISSGAFTGLAPGMVTVPSKLQRPAKASTVFLSSAGGLRVAVGAGALDVSAARVVSGSASARSAAVTTAIAAGWILGRAAAGTRISRMRRSSRGRVRRHSARSIGWSIRRQPTSSARPEIVRRAPPGALSTASSPW
jgi:hypothetical protein